MVKSKCNVIIHRLSGKIGDMPVLIQLHDKTVVSKMPHPGAGVSEKQLAQRKRFKQVVFYGKTAIESPATLSFYETVATKERRIPFNVAVADFSRYSTRRSIGIRGRRGRHDSR